MTTHDAVILGMAAFIFLFPLWLYLILAALAAYYHERSQSEALWGAKRNSRETGTNLYGPPPKKPAAEPWHADLKRRTADRHIRKSRRSES